jgi:hypothetical protein
MVLRLERVIGVGGHISFPETGTICKFKMQ